MKFKIATSVAVGVCLLSMTACAPASTPPPVSVQTPARLSPLPAAVSPTPTPCATAETSMGGSTSTTFASPVFTSPLTELPTPSPDELATRDAAVLKANSGPPTMAAGPETALPPCPTPTPVDTQRATLPAPQAVPATPNGG